MAYWKYYHTPRSLEEAIALLVQYGGRARMVGGGTDLLLEIQQGRQPQPEALIDPQHIPGLKQITEEKDFLILGAAVTHTQIVGDERIRRHGTCLVESCGVIGGPQVRNVATLAGNIAHALPAGDGTIGLLTLGGELQVASDRGLEWMPMEKSFLGPGKSAVDSSHMLIARMRFKPTGPNESSAFRRVMRPQGVALPMIAMAARMKLDGNTITAARVTIGPAGAVPFVAEKTSGYLTGRPATEENLSAAADIAAGEGTLRDSKHRATAQYRHEMVRIQMTKVLSKAAERARMGAAEPEGVGI